MKMKNWQIMFLVAATSPVWGLSIAPSRTEVRLTPGASTQFELTATNDDKVTLQVEVSKKDWFIPQANKVWTVDRWMDLQGPAHFYLKPGESHKIQVTVNCPKELQGEVVAMASFVYRTEQPSNVTPMISVSVYLMAAGTEKMAGEVEDFLVRIWNGQVNVNVKVKATGNVHLRPSGYLAVQDAHGKEWARMAVAEGQPTYPGSDAIYFGSVPADVKIPPGRYIAVADLAYKDVKLNGKKEFTILTDGQIQMSPKK
jgi:hypothetical protein